MVLFIFFFINLAIRLLFIPFFDFNYHSTGLIINVDGFAYLLKSLEIAQGNFTPMRTHSIGWPLFTAPFFYFFKSDSIFINMFYAQLINSFISSLTIFPLYLIGRKLLSKQNTFIALTFFTLSFWFSSTLGFFAEPLFTLVLLFAVYFIIKARENQNFILLASFFAGFSYWIKPNGILVLIAILLSFWFLRKQIPKFRTVYLLYATIIFFAISSPFLYQRYVHFDSPLYYGENSKYFVDTYEQLWGQINPDISFIEYLKTHSFLDYFKRFGVFGLGSLIFALMSITLPFSIFLVWGLICFFKEKKYIPLLIIILVWLAALTPIYAVYFTPRLLVALIPIASIFAAAGLNNILERNSNKNLLTGLVLALSLMFLVVSFFYPQYYFIEKRSYNAMEFSRWVAANIKGKIAIALGGELIMAQLPDATVAGVGLFDIQAPKSGLSIIYPGYFEDVKQLEKWLKDNNVSYLALNRDYEPRIRRRIKIYTGKDLPSNFKKIYSDYDNQSSWAIDFYEIQ